MFDAILTVIFLLVTYLIQREGFWGAVLIFWNIIFAGVFAFCTFEAVGGWIEDNIAWLGGFPRFLALTGLFGGTLAALRWATDSIAPLRVKFNPLVDQSLRWLTAMAAAFIVVGILCCMIQVAPVTKTVMGSDFTKTFYRSRPDFFWLLFVWWSSNAVFPWDPSHTFPGPSLFIAEYYLFRPYGTGPLGP